MKKKKTVEGEKKASPLDEGKNIVEKAAQITRSTDAKGEE